MHLLGDVSLHPCSIFRSPAIDERPAVFALRPTHRLNELPCFTANNWLSPHILRWQPRLSQFENYVGDPPANRCRLSGVGVVVLSRHWRLSGAAAESDWWQSFPEPPRYPKQQLNDVMWAECGGGITHSLQEAMRWRVSGAVELISAARVATSQFATGSGAWCLWQRRRSET